MVGSMQMLQAKIQQFLDLANLRTIPSSLDICPNTQQPAKELTDKCVLVIMPKNLKHKTVLIWLIVLQ